MWTSEILNLRPKTVDLNWINENKQKVRYKYYFCSCRYPTMLKCVSHVKYNHMPITTIGNTKLAFFLSLCPASYKIASIISYRTEIKADSTS